MEAYKTNFADDETTEASSESSDSDWQVEMEEDEWQNNTILDEVIISDSESANSGESVADVDTIECDTTTDYFPFNSSSSDEEEGPSPPKRRVPDWLRELDFNSDSDESEGWRSFSSTEEY